MDEHEFPPLGAEPRPRREQSREPARSEAVRIEARIDDSGVESVDVEDKGYGSGNGRRSGRRAGQSRKDRSDRREAGQAESSADEDAGEPEWRVVVLDTSALLWAPQGVRGLVRQGLEVIVPAEGELRVCARMRGGVELILSIAHTRSAQVGVVAVSSCSSFCREMDRAFFQTLQSGEGPSQARTRSSHPARL